MVVEDSSNAETVRSSMNVDKLASKHAEHLATLNARQGTNKVAYAQKELSRLSS